jgi:Transposase, Mutator family
VLGAPWQRCTVHFLRGCLGHARRDQHGLLAALIRPIFNADSPEQARDRLSEAVTALEGKLPKVATMLEGAEEDILAFYAFPADHWCKLRSTNPLERFNREIGRRTDVVGIFPDDQSLIRLASMLAIEQNDEWLVGRRYLAPRRWGRSSRSGPIATPTRRSSSSNRPEQPPPSPRSVSAISSTTSWDLTLLPRGIHKPASHGCRSGTVSDRAPADARSSSSASVGSDGPNALATSALARVRDASLSARSRGRSC